MGEPGYRREMMLAEGLEWDIPERYYLIVARGFIECAPEKFFRVLQASPDSIIITDRDSAVIMDANGAFERITGYARAEVVGRTVFEIGLYVDPGWRARTMANVLGNVARVDRMQRRIAQMTLFELNDAVRVLSGVSNLNVAQANRIRSARTRIETVVATSGTSASAFNTRMSNLGSAFNDLDLADTEISANINFQIGNGTRMDCEGQVSDTYVDLFNGCAMANLTDDEKDALNDCFNAGGSCPAEADYQAIADAVCSGQSPPGAPEACDQANAVLSRCSECIDNPC